MSDHVTLDEHRKSSALLDTTFNHEVALLSLSGGLSSKQIATVLSEKLGHNVTWQRVKKSLASDDVKAIVDDLTSKALSNAKALLKKEMSLLVPKAVAVIKQHLEEGNLQAVPLVFKVLGVDQEEQQQGGTQLIVNIPGISNEKEVQTIEVKDDV